MPLPTLKGTALRKTISTKWAIKTVSSAEILALNSTPKELIPAPGANLSIKTMGFFLCRNIFVTTAYTSHQLSLEYATTSLRIAELDAGFIDAVATTFGIFEENTTNNSEVVENQALRLTTVSGNPTTGDGTLKLWIPYVIVFTS